MCPYRTWGDVQRSEQLRKSTIVAGGEVNMLHTPQAKRDGAGAQEYRDNQFPLVERIRNLIHYIVGGQRLRREKDYHALAGFQRFLDSAVPTLPTQDIQLIQP